MNLVNQTVNGFEGIIDTGKLFGRIVVMRAIAKFDIEFTSCS